MSSVIKVEAEKIIDEALKGDERSQEIVRQAVRLYLQLGMEYYNNSILIQPTALLINRTVN